MTVTITATPRKKAPLREMLIRIDFTPVLTRLVSPVTVEIRSPGADPRAARPETRAIAALRRSYARPTA
jgi:hypothetical protein